MNTMHFKLNNQWHPLISVQHRLAIKLFTLIAILTLLGQSNGLASSVTLLGHFQCGQFNGYLTIEPLKSTNVTVIAIAFEAQDKNALPVISRINAWVLTQNGKTLRLIEKSPSEKYGSIEIYDGINSIRIIDFLFENDNYKKPEAIVMQFQDAYEVFPISHSSKAQK